MTLLKGFKNDCPLPYVHAINRECQGFGYSATRMGQHKTQGAHLRPLLLPRCRDKTVELFGVQVFSFSVDSEQFVGHLFTLAQGARKSRVSFAHLELG
jgi:hypothetical protein